MGLCTTKESLDASLWRKVAAGTVFPDRDCHFFESTLSAKLAVLRWPEGVMGASVSIWCWP